MKINKFADHENSVMLTPETVHDMLLLEEIENLVYMKTPSTVDPYAVDKSVKKDNEENN